MSELEISIPELDELASEVGEFICYWGFKKIHGRLWTYVYLSSQPLDASQLMKRLKVSKALISLSINELLRYDVILENGKSSRGTQTYVANPNVLDVILNVLRRRERKMLAKAETGHKMLSSVDGNALIQAQVAPERVQSLGGMIHRAQHALGCLLDLATLDMTGWQEDPKKTSQPPQ